MKILVVEDNKEIVDAVNLAFRISWPEARLVATHSGQKGIELAEKESPDIAIIDLGLPDISGFEVLRQIRLFSTVPVIILTVRSEESDIIKGLEWGADDYITKPFKQMELIARIRALMRRQSPAAEELPLSCGSLHFIPATKQIFNGNQEINLTRTESLLLNELMKNAGHIVTYNHLTERVWGDDYPGAIDSLRVNIRRLREKLETDPSHPCFIRTKMGIGYFIQDAGKTV